MITKRIGGKYHYTRINYGPDEDPYRAHSNQIVTVSYKLADTKFNRGFNRRYMVEADDGWRGVALGRELRTPRKAKKAKQNMLFIVCRHPLQEFFTVHTTFDKATYQCDKLTKKFGPTFVIVEAPLDP